MKVFTAIAVLVIIGGVTMAQADVVYDFGTPPSKSLGTSYSLTQDGYTLTAYGFNSPSNSPHNLYRKYITGNPSEQGLGLTCTDDNELTLSWSGRSIANYIQLDFGQLLTSTKAWIAAGSVNCGEKFDLFGSNQLGLIGTKILNGSSANETFVAIPQWNQYRYISMAVHPDPCNPCDNVLLGAVKVTNPNFGQPPFVPLPASATMGLVGLAMVGAMKFIRRRAA